MFIVSIYQKANATNTGWAATYNYFVSPYAEKCWEAILKAESRGFDLSEGYLTVQYMLLESEYIKHSNRVILKLTKDKQDNWVAIHVESPFDAIINTALGATVFTP